MQTFHNQLQLIGRAGSSVDFTVLSDGSQRAILRLYQHDHSLVGADDINQVFTLVGWNGVADQLHERVRRGDRLMVQGKLVNRKLCVRDVTMIKSEVHVSFFTIIATRSVTRAVGVVAEPEIASFSRS